MCWERSVNFVAPRIRDIQKSEQLFSRCLCTVTPHLLHNKVFYSHCVWEWNELCIQIIRSLRINKINALKTSDDILRSNSFCSFKISYLKTYDVKLFFQKYVLVPAFETLVSCAGYEIIKILKLLIPNIILRNLKDTRTATASSTYVLSINLT